MRVMLALCLALLVAPTTTTAQFDSPPALVHVLHARPSAAPSPLAPGPDVSFGRMTLYGTAGASAGALLLGGIMAAGRGDWDFDRDGDGDDDRLWNDGAGDPDALLALFLVLPYAGSLAGVAVAAGSPVRGDQQLVVAGVASLLGSLVGVGLGALVSDGLPAAMAVGFVTGAGVGAAAGYLEARRLPAGQPFTLAPAGRGLSLHVRL